LDHEGSAGLQFIILFQSMCAIGAQPIGAPGWPLFAWQAISAERHLTVLTHLSSSALMTSEPLEGT
jgi:hypothetical protein